MIPQATKIIGLPLTLITLFNTSLIAQENKILSDVRQVMEDSRVVAAFEYIDAHDEETVNTLITLTEIPAPPFAETERALAFLEMLNSILRCILISRTSS